MLNALTGRNPWRAPATRRAAHSRLISLILATASPSSICRATVSPKHRRRGVGQWTRLIRDYLRGRVGLRRLCLLIDARHGLKPVDREIMVDARQVRGRLSDRTDEVRQSEGIAATDGATEKTVGEYRAGAPQVIATSARHGVGIADFRAELALLSARRSLGKTTPEFPRREETEKSDDDDHPQPVRNASKTGLPAPVF